MIYAEHRPAPPLGDYVETLWYCADYFAGHRREAVLPNGSTAFIIPLAGRGGPPLVAGIHTRFMVIDTADLDAIAGVHFRPGGAMALLGGVPVDRFRESHELLESVWPRAAVEELRERAALAASPRGKLAALEEMLLERLAERFTAPETVRYAIQRLGRAPHVETVASVAERTGLSARRLGELFHRHVGVPPKVFARIKRFGMAVRRLDEGREVRWAELAADCGFYDQSHFLHEFREFSGLSPNGYRAGRGAWRNHVVID